ncbi:MAG TPA: response regulator transcription factor [Methylomirabilota bacterium]|nr:response regulator transcription factor [Methylomirabilota bacterium]
MKSKVKPPARPESNGNGCHSALATASNRKPEPSTPARVVIVEDEEGVRISLKVIVESRGEFVCTGLFADAETALHGLPALNPDIVLMDINLPGMSGIECARQLQADLPRVAVVMVSAIEDKATVQAAAQAGCSDFVTKPFNVSQLLTTLYVVMNQHTRTSASGHWAERWNQLTDHERMLARLIAKGLSDKVISGKVGRTESTLHWEIHSLLGKLHVQNRTEMVEYVYRNEGFDWKN